MRLKDGWVRKQVEKKEKARENVNMRKIFCDEGRLAK